MRVTRKIWSTRRNPFPNVTLSAAKSHMETNPGFNGDKPANSRLSHGTTKTEFMEFSQRFRSRRRSPGTLHDVDWSTVAFRRLCYLSKRRCVFAGRHHKTLRHAKFIFCEPCIVIHKREKDQQDAALSH